ncbi:hypothetical protein AC1031_018319 [Aphanomyces cochlioides]|nr:hypothetical protein AC1031_018319 [Aphanomyces cochlioides]
MICEKDGPVQATRPQKMAILSRQSLSTTRSWWTIEVQKRGSQEQRYFEETVDLVDVLEDSDDTATTGLSYDSHEQTNASTIQANSKDTSQRFSRKPAQLKKPVSASVSQAEALMSGLQSVGDGLKSIGDSMNAEKAHQNDQTVALTRALERQAAAFEAQTAQIQEQNQQTQRLIQILLAREIREDK